MQMSDPVQKALLAVGSGLALILSIIALVVALNAGGHGGKHDGGRMFGGAQQGQIGGGPGQRGKDGPGIGGQRGPGVGGPGQRQGMIPPGGVQVTPNGTGTTTTK
jgi:hypothetical protein